MICIQ